MQAAMDKKTILIVEDERLVREMLIDALRRDYIVLEAADYSGVIPLLNQQIDLALIDYHLPDSDGFEVLKSLRKVKPDIPAIIMTAFGSEGVVIRALRSNVADYIKKPLRISYLKSRLSEIFTGKNGHYKDSEYERDTKRKDEFIMEGVATYIEEHYANPLTLEKVATLACMNKFKFCKLFKEKIGQSFSSFLNSVRVRNASDLLRNADVNISEIATCVGFKNVIHFNRVFKTVNKVTPSEYRRQLNNL